MLLFCNTKVRHKIQAAGSERPHCEAAAERLRHAPSVDRGREQSSNHRIKTRNDSVSNTELSRGVYPQAVRMESPLVLRTAAQCKSDWFRRQWVTKT
jgi:hypothetical protein